MWQERILTTLDRFQAAGVVDVILDPVHLGGNDPGNFWIPDWAWNQQLPGMTPVKSASYPVWADNGAVQNNGQRVKTYLQELIDAGILNHPAVIGIEVVNEPHPRPGSGGAVSSAAQQQIATTYHSIAGFIRNHSDPALNNDVIVLGACHGGTRFGGELTGTSFEHPVHLNVVSASHPDTVWTAHNYYTGTGDDGDVRNDGLKNDGGLRNGFWVESAGVDAGCYVNGPRNPTFDVEWGCPVSPDRTGARAGHRNNAYGHWLYAQLASMPFFMGEWGAPRQRRIEDANGNPSDYLGLDGSEMMYCDKIDAYDDPNNNGNTSDAISWAVWSFDAAVDAFSLYNVRDNVNGGDLPKSYLAPNAWVNAGNFPSDAEHGHFAGDPWTYATPFTNPGSCD